MLRKADVNCIPKHLNLWLSKNLLNFAETAHQLYRQKLCTSPSLRSCLLEPELDTLHVLDCRHEVFMCFKRNIFAELQQDVLRLTEEDLTPLLLLEAMFQA